MSRRDAVFMTFLVMAGVPTAAQDLRRQVQPELDLYINAGEQVRFVFQDEIIEGVQEPYREGHFAFFVDVALRPIFRRAIRHDPDVFRNRYLTFRAGYQYSTSLASGNSSSENRAILETNARYPIPLGFVIKDRNREEFRFIRGQAFSTRYRNRLWLEHDLKFRTIAITPYVSDEVFFDTRYHAWSANRLIFGLQAPVGKLVLEPYLQRQHNYQGSTRHIDALGFKLNVYL
jgi:Protein of unknown function (DUF2490)